MRAGSVTIYRNKGSNLGVSTNVMELSGAELEGLQQILHVLLRKKMTPDLITVLAILDSQLFSSSSFSTSCCGAPLPITFISYIPCAFWNCSRAAASPTSRTPPRKDVRTTHEKKQRFIHSKFPYNTNTSQHYNQIYLQANIKDGPRVKHLRDRVWR